MRTASPRRRLLKIAEAHHVDTLGSCRECGGRWPCFTYSWATDAHLLPDDPFRLLPKDDHEPTDPDGTRPAGLGE